MWLGLLGVAVLLGAGMAAFGHDEAGPLPVVVTEQLPDRLSKDAVYTGSLAFAGLVLFGSAILAGTSKVSRKDPLQRRIGACLVAISAFALGLIHLSFPYMYGDPDWSFQTITLWSILITGLFWCGYVVMGPGSTKKPE